MEIWNIDQRDLQRKGGGIARYPVSYIISLLLQRIVKLKLNIVDLTYGEGRFWVIPFRQGRIEFIVGVDIEVRPWIIKPDIFIPKPLQKVLPVLRKLSPFDLLCIDPPFYEKLIRGQEKRKHYYAAWGRPLYLLKEGYKIAAELNIPYVIAHFNKPMKPDWYDHIIEVHFKPRGLFSSNYYSYFWLSKLNKNED